MDRDAVIAAVQAALAERGSGVVAAYLFGSVARGDEGPDSDVDVAILRRDGPVRGLEDLPIDLSDAIEARVGRPVDVVVLNGAEPDFIHRVLRDGIIVQETDLDARIRFEVQARNEYFDILPTLRRYRRTVLDSL